MWSLIEYLKRPELVVATQEWFGVEYLDESEMCEHDLHLQTGQIVDNSSSNGGPNCDTLRHRRQDNDNDDADRNAKRTHRRNISNESNESSAASCSSADTTAGSQNDHDDKELHSASSGATAAGRKTKSNACERDYQINNKFWYYLFLIGTELGDEFFYATMIPFWFWNIDGAVGRRVVFVWSIVMYVGQGLKDIIRWPRPGHPVQRLASKWSIEYGMPSTHAMVSIAMPFSVTIYMLDRYQYSATTGFILSTVWSLVICMSRIYLGMHSVADVIAGILLTVFLMIPVIPLVDRLDHIILSTTYSPIVVIVISVLLIVYYPRSDKWTPTRGDTTMTTSVTTGILVAAWLNYQLGSMQPPSITTTRPYEIIWPTYRMLGLMILRTVLGLCCVVATRALGKSITYAFVCALLRRDKNEIKASESSLENRDKIIVELSYKFVACSLIGFNTNWLLPNVFKMLGIGRPDFYTEI